MQNSSTVIMNAKHEFKILSIDGGGFKGLSAATALQVIESHNGVLLDHFDLICGTSTGGLIALALSIGKQSGEIVDFYRKSGPVIFPPLSRLQQFSHYIKVAASTNKHKYPNQALKEATQEILGECRMQHAQCFLCIPSLSMTTFRPRVFKTDHDPSLTRDSQLSMVDVALATSAAPTFFPITMCNESDEPQFFVDGGLWANNPAMVGLTEAFKFFAGPDKPYGAVSILSVGCSAGVAGRMASPEYSRWGHAFVSEMIEASGEAQQCTTMFQIDALRDSFCVPVKMTRVDIMPLSGAQAKSIKLDSATPQATQTLFQLGADTGHNWKAKTAVAEFFATPAAKVGLNVARQG